MENREAIKEELITFIRELIAGFKAMKPTLEQLLPLAKDFVLFIVEAIAETGQLFKEIKQLDVRMSEKFGPAWEAVITTIKAAADPFTAIANVIGLIVTQVDKLLAKLEEIAPALAIVSSARDLIGGSPSAPAVKRGASGFNTGPFTREAAGTHGGGGVSFSQANSVELRAAMSNQKNTKAQRDMATAFLPAAIMRERAVVVNAQRVMKAAKDSVTSSAILANQQKVAAAFRRGKITESGRKGGGGGKGKRKSESVSDAELLKLISKAGASGESLDSLIGGRKLEGGAPPVISVTVTNFNVEQTVDAPVTVTGVPGEQVEELARRVEETQRDVLQSEYRRALEEMDPLVAR